MAGDEVHWLTDKILFWKAQLRREGERGGTGLLIQLKW